MLNNHKGHSVFLRKGGKSGRPCLTNFVFQSSIIDENYVKNKLGLGNAKIYGNGKYYDGIYSKSILNIGNEYVFVDKLEILRSTDGSTWTTWETGDPEIIDLFVINEDDRTITFCEGLEQYVSHIVGYYYDGEEYHKVFDILNSSNDYKDYNFTNLGYNTKNALISRFDNTRPLALNYTTNKYLYGKEVKHNNNNILCIIAGQSNAKTDQISRNEVVGNYAKELFDKVFVMDIGETIFTSISDRFNGILPYKSEIYYGLEKVKQTGKNVYIIKHGVDGKGFSTSPSYLVSSGEYADDIVSMINNAKTIIPDYECGDFIWNQGEIDSVILSNATAWGNNFIDLYKYVEIQTGVTFNLIMTKLNVLGEYVRAWNGDVINSHVDDICFNVNSDNYIGGKSYETDGIPMDADIRHYYNTPESYWIIYSDIAKLSENKDIERYGFKISNTKCLKLSSNLDVTSLRNIGSKSFWYRLRFDASSGSYDTHFYDFDGSNGMRLRVTPSGTSPVLSIWQSGVLIIQGQLPGSSDGDVLFGFTWDGTATSNAVKTFSKVLDRKSNIQIGNITPLDVEMVASTNDLECYALNRNIYSISSINRVLTDDELTLISEGKDYEISGLNQILCNEGYGDSIYDTDGNLCLTSGVTWVNEGIIPHGMLYENNTFELQINTGNYRIVPNGVVEAGWVKVENISKNKLYDIFGGNISHYSISDLIEIDIDNYIYNINGIKNDIDLSTIRTDKPDYINILSDDYGITDISIKSVNIYNDPTDIVNEHIDVENIVGSIYSGNIVNDVKKYYGYTNSIIKNGHFTENVNGWYGETAQFAWSSDFGGSMRFERTATGFLRAIPSVSIQTGVTYRLLINVLKNDNYALVRYFNGSTYVTITSTTGEYEIEFEAQGTLFIINIGGNIGDIVYVDDIMLETKQYIYIPLKLIPDASFEFLFSHYASYNIFPNFEDNYIDFTNGGLNTKIPVDLNNYSVGDIPQSILDGRMYYKPILDSEVNLIGISNICIYDKDEPVPENICQFKTAKYCKLFPDYYEKDNEGNLIIDDDGNYILLADWYQL